MPSEATPVDNWDRNRAGGWQLSQFCETLSKLSKVCASADNFYLLGRCRYNGAVGDSQVFGHLDTSCNGIANSALMETLAAFAFTSHANFIYPQ